MLVGEPPFNGPTAQAIVAQVVTESPRALTARRGTIPPNVDAATLVALEKLPADRFASAADFASALANPSFAGARKSVPAIGAGEGVMDYDLFMKKLDTLDRNMPVYTEHWATEAGFVEAVRRLHAAADG